MRLSNRLRRLEGRLGGTDPGCPACRDRRGLHVLVTARMLPDGTLTHPDGEPTPCEQCGEVPEFVIEMVETVVESPTPGSHSAAVGYGPTVAGEGR